MKTNYKNFFLGLLGCVAGTMAYAQHDAQCGQTGAMHKLYAKHPELVQKQVDYDNAISQAAASKSGQKAVESIYTIPVVFHVIHTYGSENISDAQIKDQMDILNRDYRKLNTDISAIALNTPFDTLAADCKLQFKLA
ncbi:MAG: hypothetical protein M3R27_09395, partial [Bacteroidota bacterium]|nr:hypothetical protein [Bacteroidota bacterium]